MACKRDQKVDNQSNPDLRQYSSAQRIADVRKVDHFLCEDILIPASRSVATGLDEPKRREPAALIEGKRVVIQAKRYRGSVSKQQVE